MFYIHLCNLTEPEALFGEAFGRAAGRVDRNAVDAPLMPSGRQAAGPSDPSTRPAPKTIFSNSSTGIGAENT